jgi:hypothetical protein
MAPRRRLTAAPKPRNSEYVTDLAASPTAEHTRSGRRILMPITGEAISTRSIEAAVRLAETETATVVLALLIRVPRELPLESRFPALGTQAMPLLDAVEQRAAAQGLTVDARIARGRTYRDALNHVLNQEPFDGIVVAITDNPHIGLSADDLKWLIQRGPAEITIVRSHSDDIGQTAVTRCRARGRG